ncbi:TIM barrel protein [Candidatus Woesearchaeota archaeon]|nr:TIM barrel protein [Candidatus Woesearchaeota archaeon]
MIYLGPAGNISSGIIESISRVNELGLNCQEIEFVRSVNLKPETALTASKHARDCKVILSCHASYFVNLNSVEPEKVIASKKRILEACRIASILSSSIKTHVVFHPGFYGTLSHDDSYKRIKNEIFELLEVIDYENLDCVLAPETTGKDSQFGSIEELVKLSNDTGCRICVDFAHIYARNLGIIDWEYVFSYIRKLEFLKKDPYLHCHFTGIEFGPKGEKKHINLTEEFFAPLARQILKEKNINFCIISESPITYEDSLLMKKVLEKIKKLG